MVAALFAVHPLHIESVAWVSERKDVLCAFFFMLTLWSYAGYVEQPSRMRYLTVTILFILGLMAKPMLVTLPFLLLLLDHWPLDRLNHPEKLAFLSSRQRRPTSAFNLFGYLVLEKLPLVMISAVSSIVTFIVQQQGKSVSSFDALPVIVRIANSLVSYVAYLWKLIVPANLSIFYPYPDKFPLWKTGGAFLTLLIISTIAIFNFRKKSYLPTGWFWFTGMLVPVIGIVQVGVQSMADRYTYLPAIGLFIVFVWTVSECLMHLGKQQLVKNILFLIIIGFFSVTSFFSLKYWKNSIALFDHAIETTERNLVAHSNLGVALTAEGRMEEAYQHFLQSLALGDHHEKTHFNIGICKEKQGDIEGAIHHFRKAIQIRPDFDLAYNGLGIVLTKQNQLEEALECFSRALQQDHEFIDALCNMSIALIKKKRFFDGIRALTTALEIDPNCMIAHLNLGLLYGEMNRIPEAVHHFSRALQIQPSDEMILSTLKTALKELRQLKEKIRSIKQQLQLNPTDYQAYYDLAVTYKKMGQEEVAFQHLSESLRINPNLSPALQDLARIHATRGRYDQALELLHRMTVADPNNPIGYYYIAGIYARKGQVDTAVEWLQQSLAKGFTDIGLLKNDVNMKNLRETDYYQSLTSGNDTN